MKKLLFIAAITQAASLPLSAAENPIDAPASKAISYMDEVVVTASLTPIEIRQSGSAVSIITAEEIAAARALTVTDLLRSLPSLAVSRNGVLGSSTQIRVRGAEGNHLLVLIDGIEVNDAAQGDEFNWAHLTAENIERIEVVRGAQSTLWGSDAVAGVVNIITKKAERSFQANLFGETGSFGTHNTGFGIGSRGEQYHFNLSGSRLTSEGENISRDGSEDDGYNNTTVHINAGWQPHEQWSLGFSGRQSEGDNEFDATPIAFPVDSDNETEFRQRFARLHADLKLLEGRWHQRFAVALSRHDNENYLDGLLTGANETRKKQYTYLNSINWDDQTQRLSLLVEHETEDFSQRGQVFFFGDPNQDRSRENDSVALEYRITPLDGLTIALGARHDDNSEFDDADTHQIQFSYLLPNGDTRFRGSYGTAVKNPTFSERFGFFTNFQGNPDLQPEQSSSWELGVDHDWLNGAMTVGLTYFRSRLEEEINGFVFDTDTFAFTSENVDGTSYREGVEATLRAKINETVDMTFSYTYTDATQSDPDDGSRDQDELRRPRHLASASLNWAATEKLNLLINVHYNGKQKDSDFNTFPATRVSLDNYTLVNVAANYQLNEAWTIYARLENLLDEDYEEVLGFQTLGIGASAGVRYNFSR